MTLDIGTPAPQSPAVPAPDGPHDLVFDVRDLCLNFGGLVCLDGVSLQMRRGEVLAVIGPNGAGKTSLFNSLTGVYRPQTGTIRAAPRCGDEPWSLVGGKMHVLNRSGIARTFQNIRLLPTLPVLDNIQVAAESGAGADPIGAILGLPRHRRRTRISEETARELLAEVGLADRAGDAAGSLSYGDQRRLEIARALATNPGVLLLDEPAAGMNPSEKTELVELIRGIKEDRGVGVLLIEHDMKMVTAVADRVVVLNFGRTIAEGTPAEIQHDPAVVEAYLGAATSEPLVGKAVPARTQARCRQLEVVDLEVRYGPIPAVKGITFHIDDGEIVAFLGANGAGKTTTQKTISGLLRPAGGDIRFDGESITGLPAHELIHRAICHVPEGRHVFPRMSVLENLEMGAYRFHAVDRHDLDRVYETFPRLAERRDQLAGTLSGGEQQMLAIGRALMGRPRLLLLDEPSMGLAPLVVDDIFSTIRRINDDGVTVLLVEQNAAHALTIADRAYVLETGRIALTGTGRELLADDRIRAAYLGEDPQPCASNADR